MVDPRLNSIHLEMPRRQEFRRARQAILGARGWQTMTAEEQSAGNRLQTAIDETSRQLPSDVQLWIFDNDYVYPLRVGLNTVGRSPDNDIVLQDGYVSRRHCTILVHTDQKAELFDTASKNGIFVNGQRLSGSQFLKPGDEIRLCDKQLVFMTRDYEAKGPNTATLAD